MKKRLEMLILWLLARKSSAFVLFLLSVTFLGSFFLSLFPLNFVAGLRPLVVLFPLSVALLFL